MLEGHLYPRTATNANFYMNTIEIMPDYATILFVVVSRKASVWVAVTTTVYTAGLLVCKGDGKDLRTYVLILCQIL